MRLIANLLVLLGAASAWASPNPLSAEELLNKTASAYQSLSSYEFHVTTSTQILANGVMQQLIETNINLYGVKPDRVRLELQSARNQFYFIQSGKAFYAYPPELNLGQMQELVFAGITDEGAGNLPLSRSTSLLLSRYANLSKYGKEARIVGEENIDLLSGRRRCYVVQIGEAPAGSLESPEQYWIDETRYLVLRSVVTETTRDADSVHQIKSTVTYKSAQANEAINPALFALAVPGKPGRSRITSAGSAPGAAPDYPPASVVKASRAPAPKSPPKAQDLSITKVKKAGE